MDTIVKAVTHSDSKRRALIVRRDHGRFGFEEQQLVMVYDEEFYPDWNEMIWAPVPKKPSFAICDTPEAAERDARGRVAWLRQQHADEDHT